MNLKLSASLSTFSLRVETTALDKVFDRVSILFVQAAPDSLATRTKYSMKRVYSIGVIAGVLGMGSAYILLLWSCVMVFHTSGGPTSSNNRTGDIQSGEPLSSSDEFNLKGSGLAVQPIIPGVTVPASHLLVLLGALLFSQVIHEAGHALAALPENVPIHTVGLGLFVCLPSAFVSLNSVAFEKLPPLPRMRIAAAGAYHNLMLWLLFAGLGWSGFGRVFNQAWAGWGTPFGLYKYVDDMGVVVQSVETESDLSRYLLGGDIITRIEDTVLAHAHLLVQGRTPLQLWHDLLLHHHRNVTIEDLPDMGWCVDREWYQAQPSECCIGSGSSSLICFTTTNSTVLGSCLDPFKIFNPPETPMALVHGRCSAACIIAGVAAAEDEPDQVCVRPKGVTRVGIVRDGGPERTVLWGGPSEEIWEQVHVTDIAPRYWFVPLGLPEFFVLFTSYTSTITLSLFFLNLLPIRHLDGTQLLSALLDACTPLQSLVPLPQVQNLAEEGHSNYDYSFAYETSERRPTVTRRQTITPYIPPVLHSAGQNGYDQRGWLNKRRKQIEKSAEVTAVGLILTVAAGNAWMFLT